MNLRQCNNLILRTCDQSWNVDFANTTQSARIIINMIVGIQGKKKKECRAMAEFTAIQAVLSDAVATMHWAIALSPCSEP